MTKGRESELSWWAFDPMQFAELDARLRLCFQLAITIPLRSVVMEYQQRCHLLQEILTTEELYMKLWTSTSFKKKTKQNCCYVYQKESWVALFWFGFFF